VAPSASRALRVRHASCSSASHELVHSQWPSPSRLGAYAFSLKVFRSYLECSYRTSAVYTSHNSGRSLMDGVLASCASACYCTAQVALTDNLSQCRSSCSSSWAFSLLSTSGSSSGGVDPGGPADGRRGTLSSFHLHLAGRTIPRRPTCPWSSSMYDDIASLLYFSSV
jgi:hypothetical protein